MSLLKKAMLAVVTFVLALVAFVAPVRHTNVDAAKPTTVYLKPNSNWVKDNTWFASYFFGNAGNTWVKMAKVSGTDYYSATVPTGDYANVIFCRMNPAKTALDWGSKWDQTKDLQLPTDGKNLFTVAANAWNNATGTWSTYTPATPIVTYNVSFVSNCDQKFTALTVNSGNKVSLTDLPVPVENGYPFEGWFTDENFENAYTGGVVSSNFTLYAKWGEYNGIATHSGVRVFFENTLKWTTVNAYAWDASGETNGGWPGKTANRLGETNIYYFDSFGDGVIFNNGTVQTVDIKPAELESTFVKPGSKDGDKYTIVSAADASMNVYFQTKANEDKFDMRLVGTLGTGAELDLANYTEVGFIVIDPKTKRTVTKKSTTVYASVEANGSVISAEELEATYVFVLTVTNVPAGEKFFVAPYAITADGNYVIGTSKTFIVL